MKILFTFLILLSLTSCDHAGSRIVYTCTLEQQQKVSKDIKESIFNANNKSDEEMEDVISQLEQTYIRTDCSQERVETIEHDGWYEVKESKKGINYYFY